jgi:hypothetical protein
MWLTIDGMHFSVFSSAGFLPEEHKKMATLVDYNDNNILFSRLLYHVRTFETSILKNLLILPS